LVIETHLPQGDSFTAQYCIGQILKPFSQEHSTKSADSARRGLWLQFNNSRCHAAKIVSEQMTRLKCKLMPHLLYLLDLAIADFYLFRVLKQNCRTSMSVITRN
jgi:hypothetical protein